MSFDGWKAYPRKLPASSGCALVYDLDSYAQRLSDDADRLFVPDDRTYVKFIDAGNQSLICRSANDIERCLSATRAYSTRILYIGQEYSLAKLQISEEAMRIALCHHEVFPPFLDIVHEFGARTERASDARGSYQELSRVDTQTFECCYLIKVVEKHGRDYEDTPWSIRQMGVYHRRDEENGESLFIILNPSRCFQQRFKQAMAHSDMFPTAGDIHNLLLSCAASNWRLYMDNHEDQFDVLKTKTHLSTVEAKGERSFLTLSYGDAQDVQVMRDTLHRIEHLLDLNSTICERVSKSLVHRPVLGELIDNPRSLESQERIKVCATQIGLQRRRVQTLLRRLDAVAESMQSILGFRGIESLHTTSRLSAELTQLAQKDNQLMLDLTTEAQQDARTLKTITVLTMFYLPASFASQLLSMGYISVSRVKAKIVFHFDGEIVIFLSLTILLLILTFGAWWWAERRRRTCYLKRASLLLGRNSYEEMMLEKQ